MIDFVMLFDNCTLPEAIEKVRIEVADIQRGGRPLVQTSDKSTSFLLTESDLSAYEASLECSIQDPSSEISRFFESRGISIEVTKELRYGLRGGDNPGIVLPRFWDGELVGVKYRAFDCDGQKWSQAPGSKSDFLYCGDEEAVDVQSDVVGVLEGELDTALVRSLGFNAVGIFGTSGVPSNPSSRFLDSVEKLTERYNHIVLIGDSDDVGVEAMHDLNAYIKGGTVFGRVPKPHKDIGDFYRSEGRDKTLKWLRRMYETVKECRPVPRGTPQERLADSLKKALVQVEDGTEPHLVARALRSELSNITPSSIRPLGDVALYGLLGELVERQLPETEADAAGLLFQAMTLCGNSLGPNPYFRVRKTKHHTNLFVCLVGETASAKGEALDCAKDLLRQADSTWEGVSGLNSGEGIAAIARDNKGGEEEDTSEKIKCVSFLETEFARLLEVSYRSGSTVGMTLRRAWEELTFQVVNKNSPLKARALVSLVGHITPKELRQKMANVDIANGFANRILWVKVEPGKDIPGAGQEINFQDLARRLNEAKRVAAKLGEMEFTQEAAQLWSSVYADLKHRPDSTFGKVTARARPNVKRMAMITHSCHPNRKAARSTVRHWAWLRFGRSDWNH